MENVYNYKRARDGCVARRHAAAYNPYRDHPSIFTIKPDVMLDRNQEIMWRKLAVHDMHKLLFSLDTGKPSREDQLSTMLLKLAAQILAEPLAEIRNIGIAEGILY